jgi:Asp-tRNA(Asn)/Glu-tRNA(Gln) amidotransferase A subunit family amidase
MYHSYEPLNAAAYGTHALTIAVPSRLRFKATAEQPLAGVRIAVKDAFDVKGTCTGQGNRAFRALATSASHSSNRVQTAVDLGAIVIGKTKSSEFGGSQEWIGDWTDYSYAFNSRADGYLVSTGSSTGSGSSIGSYSWVDVTIGTDGNK